MNLVETMQANPTAELVVTMDPGHPAYLRDSVNREKFLDGPFEPPDYQPLIDDGTLAESPDFCSVFVFNPQPPDFSELHFSGETPEQMLEIMREHPGSFLMGDPTVSLFADESGTEKSILIHNFDYVFLQQLIESGDLICCGPCHWTLKSETKKGAAKKTEDQANISQMIDVSTHNHIFASGGLWEFVSYDSPEYEKALVDNPEYTGPVFKEVATTRDIIISGLNHYIPRPGDRELESLTQDVFEELKGRS